MEGKKHLFPVINEEEGAHTKKPQRKRKKILMEPRGKTILMWG